MFKRKWLIVVGLAIGWTLPAPCKGQVTGAAPVPASASNDAYEAARQKLRETLASAPPAVAAQSNPAVSAQPVASAAADGVASAVSGATPAESPVQLALMNVAELPSAMRGLDDKQKLSPSDRVSFKVLEDREDPKPLIVTDSGEMEIPYVGRVKAQDKTCLQVAREAKALLEKDYYHKATVLISVDALSRTRGRVYLYGFVRTPGPAEIPADEKMTVGKVILRAGGFADFANKRKVTLTRKSPDGQSNQVFEIDMVDVLEKGHQERDMEVRPDDMIWVPQRMFNF